MSDELPYERLSNEEYAEHMIEQVRINAELEESNERIQDIINQILSEEYNG